MNCRECHGTGWIPDRRCLLPEHLAELKGLLWEICPAEGCHNGQTHCCDGENVDLALNRSIYGD